MSFATEVFAAAEYPSTVAELIEGALPASGAIVITGGTTAARVYRHLSMTVPGLDVFFSDERCVPPDDDASNFKMANECFLERSDARVHRMQGELPPEEGAAHYHREISSFVDKSFGLTLLGMGADCHIGALFPGSPALHGSAYCAAVDRPDGLSGLTLTPSALRAARRILLLVTGEAKAEAVRRAIRGNEDASTCPARLLADHADATFLLDEPAAAMLTASA